MKTVLIIDDDPGAIANLKGKLHELFPMKRITWSKNPVNTLESLSFRDAEIIFLDIEMPQMSGMHFYKQIKNKGYKGRVVFTTAFYDYVLDALREHAFDFLLKPIDTDELKACVERINSDDQNDVKDFTKLSLYGLSKREITIIERVFKGMSSHEIGEHLFISKNTVDTHRRNILQKTGCKNTTELFTLL